MKKENLYKKIYNEDHKLIGHEFEYVVDADIDEKTVKDIVNNHMMFEYEKECFENGLKYFKPTNLSNTKIIRFTIMYDESKQELTN